MISNGKQAFGTRSLAEIRCLLFIITERSISQKFCAAAQECVGSCSRF